MYDRAIDYIHTLGDYKPKILNHDQAVKLIIADHIRLKDILARQRRWFWSASYWKRLLLTWSGFPW